MKVTLGGEMKIESAVPAIILVCSLVQIILGGLYIFHNLILFLSLTNFFSINILSLGLTLTLGFSHKISLI